MVQEGLRRIEVTRLEIGDIDLIGRTIRVTGKGDHERLLPLTREAEEAIRDYLRQYPATTGPLIRSFHNPTLGVRPNTVSGMVHTAMLMAGVKQASYDGVTPHALRHSCATDMLRAGAHVRDVQRALGHQTLATTETYMPLLVNELRDAMEGRRYTEDP